MLFADIKEDVLKQGYPTNGIIINEYMIRAIECCFCEMKSIYELNERVNINIRQGFKDIDYIYRLVKEKVFDIHQKIQDVYLELLESFILYLRNK